MILAQVRFLPGHGLAEHGWAGLGRADGLRRSFAEARAYCAAALVWLVGGLGAEERGWYHCDVVAASVGLARGERPRTAGNPEPVTCSA